MTTRTAIVVGAGIGGLTAAVALRKVGVDVEIYEAAPERRISGTGLGIASNATAVLDALGIDIRARGQVVQKFELLTTTGELMRELPIPEISEELGAPVVSIHRAELAAALHDAVGDTPIHYGAQAVGYSVTGGRVSVRFDDGRSADADLLVGADGIRSVIRAQLQGAQPVSEYGYLCWLATVPFSHPKMTTGYAGHYWGRGRRFGLIDIGGGRAYWWGTQNMAPEAARQWQGSKKDVLASYAGWAPEVVQAIEQTDESAIVAVPAQDRPFSDKWGEGPVTLVGDAAHPMLTSLSQGAGSSIEDGYVLAHHLAANDDVDAALRDYEHARIPRTRKLVADSRRLSKSEQLENPIARGVRDFFLRHAPAGVVKKINAEPMLFTPPGLESTEGPR